MSDARNDASPAQPAGQDQAAQDQAAQNQAARDQAAQPAAPARPAQPEYGEYAPEGWVWTPPEGTEAAVAETGGSGAAGSVAASAQRSASARPSGVPHNLGAPGQQQAPQQGNQQHAPQQGSQQHAPQQGGQQAALGSDQSYRAAAAQPGPVYGAPRSASPRTGDRVVTIMLLVFGAFGALSVARSFFALESQISLMGTLIGMDSPKVESWVGTLGVASALAVLLVYALNLILSIQRMRARKITFWVPLVAATIAFVILLVVPMIAMGGAPEIMQQIEADPNGALSKMLDSLQEMQQP